MKLLVPDTIDIQVSSPEVEVITYGGDRVPDEHTDAEALVLWGESAPFRADAVQRLSNLRWVQTLAAGPDAVLKAGFADQVTITSGSGLHDRPVAEHALMLALAAARRLPLAVRAQQQHRWASELGGLQSVNTDGTFRTLRNARVSIWGFGNIGQALAPLLTQLGATVTGIARSAGERAGYPVVAEDQLATQLAQTDLLVMILPSTDATDHALNADRLAQLPQHAWVLNVGRGSTVDEQALVAAVREGRIGGAALDVTETEPLPAESPLWDEENIILTPHGAGGRPLDASELVQHNLDALRAGTELTNVVRPGR